MLNKVMPLAFLVGAVVVYSFGPAHAGAKEDCEAALKQAEEAYSTSSVDAQAAGAAERLLQRARASQSAGQYKGCVKQANSAKNKVGG